LIVQCVFERDFHCLGGAACAVSRFLVIGLVRLVGGLFGLVLFSFDRLFGFSRLLGFGRFVDTAG
jgi:hypothetical protein